MSVTILQGDARTVLQTLEAGSIHTCITSPPYYGLRDYGTASWEGGAGGCDHRESCTARTAASAASSGLEGSTANTHRSHVFSAVCGRCGAQRVDAQIGTEETPQAYVAHLVEVFRGVHRVLRDDGTCWVVIGDSFASSSTYNTTNSLHTAAGWKQDGPHRPNVRANASVPAKNLLMIPHRVALALQADGWIVRNDCVWAKSSAMPESVQDRFSRAHEYVFHLAKSERYYFDAIAVAEKSVSDHASGNGYKRPQRLSYADRGQDEQWTMQPTRNRRSVLHINPQPFSGARLLADYVDADGKPYIVSEDCPIHGLRQPSERTQRAGCDGPQGHPTRRTSGTCADRVPAPLGDVLPSVGLDASLEGCGTDSAETPSGSAPSRTHCHDRTAAPQSCRGTEHTPEQPAGACSGTSRDALSATGRSSADRRMDHAPLIGPADRPSAETLRHTGDTSEQLSFAVLARDTQWSSRSGDCVPGGSGLSGQTDGHSADTATSGHAHSHSRLHGKTAQCTCQEVTTDHYAVFPEKLVEILTLCSTSEAGCCPRCGAPHRRVVERERSFESGSGRSGVMPVGKNGAGMQGGGATLDVRRGPVVQTTTTGWQPGCSCGAGPPIACTTLDPFLGSGTLALVSKRLGRSCIGIELNPAYAEMARRRVASVPYSLFSGANGCSTGGAAR